MMRVMALGVMCLLATAGFAEQLSFKAKAVGNVVRFDYRWLDSYRAEHQLAFALPIDDLQRGQREFKPFDNKVINQAAFNAVQGYAKSNSVNGTEVRVKPEFSGGFTVEVNGPETEVGRHMKAMEGVRDKAVKDFVYDNFYTRVDDTHVMPDHKRIAQRYAPALRPMQEAIRKATQGLGVRDTVDYVMSFLQSIPYDTLQSRYTSNGAGFQTPYGLLTGNRGDCDSKSVALAAILRGIYPNTRITMVYVDEHAFVGIAVPRGSKDYALRLGGEVFVLADPTGPRLTRLGEVDAKALRELERGRYSYQEILY